MVILYHFQGRNIWWFMCRFLSGIPSSTFAISKNPKLACMIAWLISYILSKGVTHIKRPVKKFQSFAEKIALFAHRVSIFQCPFFTVHFSLITYDTIPQDDPSANRTRNKLFSTFILPNKKKRKTCTHRH
jgi:hypothetical protein